MRYPSSVLLIAALTACGYEPQLTPPFDARLHQPSAVELGPRYTISYLPTLDGSRNRPSGIGSNGLIAGFVNRPGNATRPTSWESTSTRWVSFGPKRAASRASASSSVTPRAKPSGSTRGVRSWASRRAPRIAPFSGKTAS